MQAAAARLDALAEREGKPVLVAEIGIRSAQGAARKPWESAEERAAEPDPELQAAVLQDWLDVLDRPSVAGVLVWEWFTDPNAGGAADTDFTVQGKPAERLLCERAKSLRRLEPVPHAGQHAVLLQGVAAGEGGEGAALHRPLRREVIDHAELQLVVVVGRKQRAAGALRDDVELLQQQEPLLARCEARR